MTTNPPRALPEEPASRSTLKPILITMLCSFLVAGGSCFGALRTFEEASRGGWWRFFMAVFLLTAITFVTASLLLIVRAVRTSIQKKR